jgi:protoporphyrinogen/coproporphyrinogen III oxidase
VTVRVAVVGGGIAGMAAAWEARRLGHDVVLHEAGSALGGKLRTSSFCGVPVDEGPDAFLARVPFAVDLCRELGLSDELVAPAEGRAYVWTRGRLRPLPPGLVLGVPTGLVGLARSGILSARGVLRAGLDVALPQSRFGDDPSVEQVVSMRFGREASERLVEPLVGGINAGVAARLSMASTAPQLAAAAARSRSLLLGLRGTAGSLEGPVFSSLRGGMGVLARRLAAALGEAGVDVRLGSAVATPPDADRVVVALPAGAAASLLGIGELAAIPHASVALVTLAYRGTAPSGSGFLVPRVDGRLMTACSFASNKWPHWSPGPGTMVLRVSAGRAGDDRAIAMSDDELVAALHEELVEALGLTSAPIEARVTRWVDGFPQYEPGHAARVARIEAALPSHVRMAGAALYGVGIPACIASGRAAVH